MGLIADFYIATEADAPSYDASQSLPAVDRAEYTGITPLELSTLLAICQGRDWDVDMMDEFECVLERNGGERLIHRIPAALTSVLAAADQAVLRAATAAWAKTDELDCSPADVQPIVDDLVRLSRRAIETGKSLYLWNCL